MASFFRVDGTPGPSIFEDPDVTGPDYYFEQEAFGNDPLYPTLFVSDTGCIDGNNYLSHNPAAPGDFQTTGFWFYKLGTDIGKVGSPDAFGQPHFHKFAAPGEFYMEVKYHPTVASLADNSYAPLMYLSQPNSNQVLGVFIGGTDISDPYLEIYRLRYFADGSQWWSSLNPDFTFGSEHHPVAGQPYTVRLEWRCGTYDEIAGQHAFDGWFKCYINGALVTEQSGIRLNLNTFPPSTTDEVDMCGYAAIGFDGLLGPAEYFEVGDLSAVVDDGGCEDPTVFYAQNFTSGTPLFHTDPVYNPAGADSPDPNYPEISYAEGLVINGSGHVDSGHGYDYDSNSMGIGEWFSYVNDLPGGPILVPEGYLQIHYIPNATSITKDADILWIYRDNGNFLSLSRDASLNNLLIESWNEDSSVHLDQAVSWTPSAGQEYIFRWEFRVGSGGYLRLKINGTTVFEDLTFEPWFDGANGTQIKTISIGGWALFGEFWDIELGTCAEAVDPLVPPMQRASYVFFSNAIVEKQVEVRLTRTYLQILTADRPEAAPPTILPLTTVVGDLYDQGGGIISSGRLYITPRNYIVVDGQLIAAKTVTYDITGPLSINLAPSSTVLYDVEYDPTPGEDIDTPRNLKSGFFKDVWQIPDTGTVDVANL